MSRVDFVGLARQDAGMGTPETVSEYYVPVETASPDTTRETLEMEETIGTRFPTGIEYGTRYFTIPMAGAPRPASLPRILSGFIEQPSTTGAGPYVHTQTATTGEPEPHTIFVARNDPDPAIADTFSDALGNELALDVAPNDFLRMDASWIALHVEELTPVPTPTSDLTKRWKFSECCVEISDDNGATWDPKQSAAWGITYRNNLDTDNAILCSNDLFSLPLGNADIDVRWSPVEDLNVNYRRYLAESPETLGIRLTATSPTATLVVTVFAFEIIDAPAPVDASEVLKMIEVTGRGKVCETGANAGKFVSFVTTNAVATYA